MRFIPLCRTGCAGGAEGCEALCGLDLVLGSSCFSEPTNRKPSTVTGKSTSPGEDSTGAGAERELGFDPQSKAELAQGEYKGAREVLARQPYTPPSRGVARGGC
jgi:hypothetical protein